MSQHNETDAFRRFRDEADDQRSRAQRDRDRVLYSSAFSRLSGVTQVAPAEEGYPYHNRLTHSLKVAQIARRIAEHLLDKQRDESQRIGIDPDVCEAAALAHDLGHPPFGHVAEACLDRLVRDEDLPLTGEADSDGFEGNAQSFRIVVHLAQRRDEFNGLNLTRSTLDAVLKYPWPRSPDAGSYKHKKYGFYEDDREVFDWVRQGYDSGADARSANAEIMNWADDIAYAVHDVEDFFRAGIVPLDRLYHSEDERRAFLDWLRKRWQDQVGTGWTAPIPLDKWDEASRTVSKLFVELPFHRFTSPYQGTAEHRKRVRRATGFLIARYIDTIVVGSGDDSSPVIIFDNPQERTEVELLKELVWYYVIDRPALRTQQVGQELIITTLFEKYTHAADTDKALLPVGMREALDEGVGVRRAAADAIAAMTERQATSIWRRMTGVSQGSLADYPFG